jgi:Arc-like DNA binding domain
MTKKTAEVERLQLRLPGALHEQLERAARKAGRSLNSEMIQRLTESFARSGESVSRSEFDSEMRAIQSSTHALIDARFREAGIMPNSAPTPTPEIAGKSNS